jgi:hypothetical protein
MEFDRVSPRFHTDHAQQQVWLQQFGLKRNLLSFPRGPDGQRHENDALFAINLQAPQTVDAYSGLPGHGSPDPNAPN